MQGGFSRHVNTAFPSDHLTEYIEDILSDIS